MQTKPLRIPDTAVLELTYRCNHQCLFCSCPWEAEGYERGREMNLAEWKVALQRLASLGVRTITLTGGETLLKEELIDLLAWIREQGDFNRDQSIVLISNGLAMSDTFLKAFQQYNVHLSLSLPGLTTFERHTGVDNASGVLEWLEKASSAGLTTTANVTVTAYNYPELRQTVAEAVLAGAGTILVNRFLPGGRGLSYMDELVLSREQLNGMLRTTEEVLQLSNRIGTVGTEFPLCIVEDRSRYKNLTIGTLCSAGKGFFVIDPAGWIRVCNHSPVKVGHILGEFPNCLSVESPTPDHTSAESYSLKHVSAESIITDVDYWNRFARRAYIPAGCTTCREVSYCDCGCRATAEMVCGSLRALDPCLG